MERHLQELGDSERDRGAHLGPSRSHFDALAVRDRKCALDGEPVAEPSTQRAQRVEDVALNLATSNPRAIPQKVGFPRGF